MGRVQLCGARRPRSDLVEPGADLPGPHPRGHDLVEERYSLGTEGVDEAARRQF